MNDIKVVFSDIDGTLVTSNHTLSPAVIQAVDNLTAKGIPFILVSSRPSEGMLYLREQLHLQTPVICYGGAYILGSKGELIRELCISPDDARKLKTVLKENFPKICCCLYSGKYWYADQANDPWIIQEQHITGIVPAEADILQQIDSGKPVHKLMCMGDPDAIAKAQIYLETHYPHLSICRSKDTYLEIMHGQASKANGVEYLCRLLSIPLANTMSLGDNFNDLPMLMLTGISVVMGNAPEEVKKHASWIAPDNDHDGVAAAIEKYFEG